MMVMSMFSWWNNANIILSFQSHYRAFRARKNYQTQKKAATKIQSNYRGYQSRKQISIEMESGALGHKKKKKKLPKYVWDKIRHCWTKVTHTGKHKEEKHKEIEPPVDNDLWELSQASDNIEGEAHVSEGEEDKKDEYDLTDTSHLTLLQLSTIYTKTHDEEPDVLKQDALLKYGVPSKSPYQSAYGDDVTPYAAYECNAEPEPNLPRKPHKVIKYKPPDEVKPPAHEEEETGFFSSMFRRKEPAPASSEAKEENILDQMGGFMGGLFASKPAPEAAKPEVKDDAAPAADEATEKKAEPAEEVSIFGKFQGLFKPKQETEVEKKDVTEMAEIKAETAEDTEQSAPFHDDDDHGSDSREFSDDERDDDGRRSPNSATESDRPSYDSDYSDEEPVREEPATKMEFQQRFMKFLKKDAGENNNDNTGDDHADSTQAPEPEEPPKAEEGNFITKLFKKDETGAKAPEPTADEQSGMDKVFGFFKRNP